MDYKIIAAVAVGGAIGSVARFVTSKIALYFFGGLLPWGTLMVNILGAFIIGLCVEWMALRHGAFSNVHAFLVVGILGGYTTFSSLAMEIGLMIERNELMQAFLYGFMTFGLGLTALFIGIYAGKLVTGN